MEKVLIDKGPDYCGRMYGPPFFVARDLGVNPGWFVFGRNPGYGWRVVKVVARPDVKPRVYKHWNGPRARGWWLKREAQVVADQLNEDSKMAFMRAEVSETPERFMISDSLDEIVFCRYSNIWLPVGLYERDEDRPDDDVADEIAYVFDMFPKMDKFEIVYMFWGQLSAPGYMDQTDYVLGDSRGDVAQQLLDMYFDRDEEYMDSDEKQDKEWLEDIVRRDEEDFRRTLKTLGEFIEGKVDNKEKRDGE